MRYWITTHWPPNVKEPFDYNIYLYDGTQSVGADIKPGDRVWIYQSKGGRKVLRRRPDGSVSKIKRQPGKEGIIALAEITCELHDIGGEADIYHDNTSRWWRWMADARLINQSGFIPREDLNDLLGYSRGHSLRAFGTMHSGLKQVDGDVHQKILHAFNQSQPSKTIVKPINPNLYPRTGHGHGQGGEGPEHKKLKERIANNPSDVLGIEGLKLIQMEYPFPTGDRIDVLLKTSENQYIAVEVEVAVDLTDISGVLQAVKYSRMCAVQCRRKYEEVRGFLVAHNITDDVKKLCKEYDIETFEVPSV